MYIRTTCKIKNKIEVQKYYHWNAGAPGTKRQQKENKTPEDMARQNLWIRKRDLRRLIELNFSGGDLHVTLTCKPERRPDMNEALSVIRKFRDKLRREYQKNKWDLKYIITTETGERGAVHWHMIVNAMQNEKTKTEKIIWELWDRGRPYFVPLDKGDDYEQLAAYIIKETSKRIEAGKTLEKMSYMCSRNLIRPVVRKKKIQRHSWSREPKAPKGYEVIRDSVVNGINKYTGLPYQHYTLRKIQNREAVRIADG